MKTSRLLAEALNLNKEEYQIAFQSRFGKQEWLKPYLASTLEALGKAKTDRIDVICPGFSSDCLETLEEIAIEGKHIFQSNGGGDYQYIPCLNGREAWINAMCDIVMENLHGWTSSEWDAHAAERQSRLTAQRAQSLGEKA